MISGQADSIVVQHAGEKNNLIFLVKFHGQRDFQRQDAKSEKKDPLEAGSRFRENSQIHL